MILSTLQISPAPASMGWRCFCMQETKPHSDRQGQSQSDNGCLAFVLQRVGNREQAPAPPVVRWRGATGAAQPRHRRGSAAMKLM